MPKYKDAEQPMPKPQELQTVETDRQVCIARFSPGGEMLLTGGYDGFVRRWKLTGNEFEELSPIVGHHGWVEKLAFHPNGKWLVSGDSWGRLHVCEFAADEIQPLWSHEQAHDGWIRGMDISNDGELLVTAGRDRFVRVWRTPDGEMLHEFEGHAEDVFAAALHPGKQAVVSCDLSGTVKHWDLNESRCVRDLDLSRMHFYDRDQDVAGVKHLAFRDAGKTLLAAGMEPTRAGRVFGMPVMHFLDWETGKIRETVKLGDDKIGFVFDFAWHPDGYFLTVTSGPPGTGRLFLHTLAEQPFYQTSDMYNCHSVALHPDGRRFVVTATNKRSQGNGAVKDKMGHYLGNSSPIHLFELPGEFPASPS